MEKQIDKQSMKQRAAGGVFGAGTESAVAAISASGASTGLSGARIICGMAAIGGGVMLGGVLVSTGA